MNQALDYIEHIGISFYNNPSLLIQPYYLLKWKMTFVYIIPLVLVDWYLRRDERKIKSNISSELRRSLYILIIFITLMNLESKSSFIYFQF